MLCTGVSPIPPSLFDHVLQKKLILFDHVLPKKTDDGPASGRAAPGALVPHRLLRLSLSWTSIS